MATSCRHPEIPANAGGSESVAPGQTSFQPNPKGATPADVATSCRHPEPQTTYQSPITDNRIYEPMAADDPNSGDIYAIDTVPKKRNPANYDPDPFSFASYWHWIKTCKPKTLPPNHPAKPPTTWNY